MQKLALLVGLTAILCALKVGILLPGEESGGLRDAITFIFALLLAWCFVFFQRLDERCRSPKWIWIAFGVCGLIVLFVGPLRRLLPYGMQMDFARLKFSFVYWVAGLAQLPLLLKLASDFGKAKVSGRRKA